MTDGVFVFPRCTPVGSVSLGAIADGQHVSRDWTFTVNGTIDAQSYIDQGVFDPRNFVVANDCQLVVDGQTAADIQAWEPTVDLDSVEFRPGGSRQKLERTVGYKVQVKLTEWVVRDALLLMKFLASLKPGAVPMEVAIQGRYHGPAS